MKTREEIAEIYIECGGDLQKVAERLGLSVDQLNVTPPAPRPVSLRKPPVDPGQAALRKHIVSMRHADSSIWPKIDEPKILDARTKYEAGTHEITQGRDRNWFILYCIPRVQRTGARKFFHAEGY